jgi:hypothetical protein
VPGSHGLRFEHTRFWVIHRRREYGPFDYDWSPDLTGVELLYQGVKFGEICSPCEVFADLQEFHLPSPVVHVASIVLGCVILGFSRGYCDQERRALIAQMLKEFDCHNFLPCSDECR